MQAPFLIIRSCQLSAKEVIQRAKQFLTEKQVKIFSHISHSDAAKEAGLTMQPEELLIFGNPKVGTALMLESPEIGIELPLKLLVWSAENETHVGYTNLSILAEIFAIKTQLDTITKLNQFMEMMVNHIIQ